MNELEVKLKLSVLFSEVVYKGQLEGRQSFEVAPSFLYPASIEDIRATLSSGRGYTNTDLDSFVRTVDPVVFDLALKPKSDLSQDESQSRVTGLEVARLWFTAKLHALVDHTPMALHITKDDRWRL